MARKRTKVEDDLFSPKEAADGIFGDSDLDAFKGKRNPNAIETGIVKRDDGALILNNIVATQIGLQFTGQLSEEEWITYGEYIVQLQTAYQWVVGDYLAYGDDNGYGRATEFAEILGKSAQTVWNWVAVAKSVEYSRRREVLSFGHHEAIASLSSNDQEKWLSLAETGNGKIGNEHRAWSVKKLREQLAKDRGEKLPSSTTEPLYKKWDNQSEERISKLLSYYQKETDKRKKNAWKRYIKSEAERWTNLMDQIDNL